MVWETRNRQMAIAGQTTHKMSQRQARGFDAGEAIELELGKELLKLDPQIVVHATSSDWPCSWQDPTYTYQTTSIHDKSTLQPSEIAKEIISLYGHGRQVTLKATLFVNNSLWITCWAEITPSPQEEV